MHSVKKEMDLLLAEHKRWQEILFSVKEPGSVLPVMDNGWSLKDVLAHLSAWQQITLARLKAASDNEEPQYPDWFPGQDPETEVDLNRVNTLIQQTWCEKSWSAVHDTWQDQFQHILSLFLLIPEEDFLAAGKFPWLPGYPLLAVLDGARSHHEEHRQALSFPE